MPEDYDETEPRRSVGRSAQDARLAELEALIEDLDRRLQQQQPMREGRFAVTGRMVALAVGLVSLFASAVAAGSAVTATKLTVNAELANRPTKDEVTRADSSQTYRIQQLEQAVQEIRLTQKGIADGVSVMNDRLRQLICDAIRAGERACRLVR